MSTKHIKITIDPIGRPTVEAIGFQGQGCVAATKPIEDALAGSGDKDITFKPELNEIEHTNTLST